MQHRLQPSLKTSHFSFRHRFLSTYVLSLSSMQYANSNNAYVNLKLMTHLLRSDIIVV
jgi:hypothetical protein